MITMCPKCLTDRYSLKHMLSHCPLALSFWSSFQNGNPVKLRKTVIALLKNMILYDTLKVLLRRKKKFSFSLYSDLTFCKNAPCHLLRLNFKNKSDFFSYDFSFKLSAITKLCSSRVASRELDGQRK